MSDPEKISPACSDLLDLGDVSQDLEALSPSSCDAIETCHDKINITDISEDSAYEHDYDNISSPGGSSTCSGPTYKRHIGFGPETYQYLGHDISVSPPSPQKNSTVTESLTQVQSRHRLSSQTSLEPRPKDAIKKKKKKGLLSASYEENADTRNAQLERVGLKAVGSKSGVLSSRNRQKKEPLPMKLRALPQSFWQQPNNANPLSPGAVFSRLPPLPGQTVHEGDLLDHVPPVTDVAGDGAEELLEAKQGKSEHRVSEANTDLLFSLFNGIEEDDSQKKIQLVRRGRPKKPPPVFSRTRMLQDEDPCLVSNMTESILPLIPERNMAVQNNNNKQGNIGTQVIKIMSISHGDKSVDLPSLNIEHNYPHLLSELVMKL